MSPSPVVRELAAPRRGAIAPAAGQTQSETRSSMGPVGQVKKRTDGQTDKHKETDRQLTIDTPNTEDREQQETCRPGEETYRGTDRHTD